MRIKTEDIVHKTEELERFFKVRPDTREFLTDIIGKMENDRNNMEYSIGAHIDNDGTIDGVLLNRMFRDIAVYLVMESYKEKPSAAIIIKETTQTEENIIAYIPCNDIYCIEKIDIPDFEGDTSYAWKYFYKKHKSKIECLLKIA